MAKLIEEIERMNEEELSASNEQDVFKLLSEHSEQIGAFLDLLKSASDTGVFTLLQGIFENKGESMQNLTEELVKDKNVRFVRNLLSIYTLLSNIDPDIVRNFMLNLAKAVDVSPKLRDQGSMGLLTLRNNMKDPDVTVGFRVLFEVAKGFSRPSAKKE